MRTSTVLAAASLLLLACTTDTTDAPPVDAPEQADIDIDAPARPAPAAPAKSLGIAAPPSVLLRAGTSVTFDAKITRSEGVTGPVALEVLELPAGVTAAAAMEGDTCHVTLTAGANAKPGDHAPLLRASATGAAGEARAALIVAGKPGTLDESFGLGGVVGSSPNHFSANALVDREGRTLVTGVDFQAVAARFYMKRFRADGTLDTSFGQGGTMDDVLPEAEMSGGRDAVLLPDGGMLVLGAISAQGYAHQPCFAKLLPNATLDKSFGSEGRSCPTELLDIPLERFAVAPDGTIYAAGTMTNIDNDIVVTKLSAAGVLDTSFGEQGILSMVRPGAQRAIGIAVDHAGRVVVGGDCAIDKRACVFRVDTMGTIDTAFAGGGTIRKAYAFEMEARSLVIGPDDEVFLAGVSKASHAAVVAFDASGKPLDGFGEAGGATFEPLESETINAAIWDDGKLLLAGGGKAANAQSARSLALRVGLDGKLDTTFGAQGYVLYPSMGAATAIALSPGRATFVSPETNLGLLRVWR